MKRLHPHASKNDRGSLLALILPSFFLLLALTAAPLLFSLGLSTTSYTIATQSTFQLCGVENYLDAFRDAKFWHAVLITLGQATAEVTIQMGLGLGMALLLQRDFWGAKLCRALFILPWAVAPVVAGLMWRMLLNTDLGWINYFLRTLGLPGVNWLGDRFFANVSVVAANVWIATPAVGIMLLAALQAIDASYYDAARMDGANAAQTFFHIVLPLIKPTAVLALLIRLMDALRQFDITYVMTGGGPGDATESLNLYAYIQTFKYWRIGYGSALSIVMMALIFAISLLLLGVLHRADDV